MGNKTVTTTDSVDIKHLNTKDKSDYNIAAYRDGRPITICQVSKITIGKTKEHENETT